MAVDLALRDLDMIAVLMRALESKPVPLVSSMIRCALGGLYLEVVEEGFARSLWHGQNLAPLQDRLVEMEFIPSFVESITESERAAMCYLLEQLVIGQYTMKYLSGGNRFLEQLIVFLPSGWVRRNQVLGAQLFQQCTNIFDIDPPRFHPRKNVEVAAALNQAVATRRSHNFLAASFIPNFSRASIAVAKTHARRSHAILACAMERHRGENGEYPPSLSSLVPRFLSTIPSDIISGQPLVYRKTAPREFILYSVGENEIDDGGVALDWVWK
jgi:hypothetical protein